MARSGNELTGFAPGERNDALTIGALFERVQRALAGAFPRGAGLWVRGEIHEIQEHRSGHCYIDLVDPDQPQGRDHFVLKVNCWRTTWGPLKAVLAGQGIALQAGMVVTLRGRVEFYAPRAQVNFVAAEIDVASLLGRLAAQRAALLSALDAEGLLRRNALLEVAPVPLRIGLVASPRSEGCDDFLGQIEASGYGFSVRLVPAQVQGPRAAQLIAAAVQRLATEECDVVVLVRGGGAKADLAAFDNEAVARAVATHRAPVWTGIGHTGDQSVADLVANRAFVTPTECGQALVKQVRDWWAGAMASGALVARRSVEVVEQASSRDVAARGRLVRGAHRQLERHAEHVSVARTRICGQSGRQLDAAAGALQARAQRLSRRAVVALDGAGEHTLARRRLMAAYDVHRQLERGYTLTLDHEGRVIRGAGAVTAGQRLVTRFADGTVGSVADIQKREPAEGSGP
ncbi:MAG: exodeoxyribonuclease VII large subunit [Acidimicrobiales bacterium]